MAGVLSITILQVTDIHDSLENIERLHLQLMREGVHIDSVLVSGDITTIPVELGHEIDKLSKYDQSIVEMLNALYKICPTVVYIPGNHDPLKLFSKQETPSLANSFVNLHRDAFTLSDGLVVAGFGGSLPGYKLGTQVWDGFPHALREDFEKDIQDFLSSVVTNKGVAGSSNDTVLLMTHVGPDGLPTATDYSSPATPITCGSLELRKWLDTHTAQERVALNIHGHTHAGVGHNQVGNVIISNPGALQDGKFGLYKMSFVEGKWKVVSIHLRILE